MLGGSVDILHEGIWKIESIEPLDEETVLVTFVTAWFESKEDAKDPQANCYDFGPHGTCLQSIQVDRQKVPTVADRNSQKTIYEYLTDNLEFDTTKAD